MSALTKAEYKERADRAMAMADAGHKYLLALCHYSYVMRGRDRRDAHWEHEAFTVITHIHEAMRGIERSGHANMGEGRWLLWGDAADELMLNLSQLEHRCGGECEATMKVLVP